MKNSLVENYLRIIQDSEIISELGVKGDYVLIAMLSAQGWTAWRKIGSGNDKARKKCGAFKISDQRDACIATNRIKFCKERIALIKKERKKCDEKRNPKKCRKNADDRIDYEEGKIKKYKKRLDKLEKKGRGYNPKTY